MSRQNLPEQTWTNEIKNITTASSGLIKNIDDNIIIEWENINPKSNDLNIKIQQVSNLLVDAYSQIELDFCKAYPDKISSDPFLQSLAPLFSDGINNVDWRQAEIQIKDILHNFFFKMDWTQFTKPEDTYIFFTVKNTITHEYLAVMQAISSPSYGPGCFKLELSDGVNPSITDQTIRKELLESIFSLLPLTQRIFFHTRKSNHENIALHEELGYQQFKGELADWIDLEYIKQ